MLNPSVRLAFVSAAAALVCACASPPKPPSDLLAPDAKLFATLERSLFTGRN